MTQPYRIVRGLGGNGGTYVCRALAAMERVVLLSETNPSSANLFAFGLNPATQIEAHYRHLKLPRFTGNVAELGAPGVFGRYLETVSRACAEQGLFLVIRDYNYIDYIGTPMVWCVAGKSSLDAALSTAEKRDVLLIRHPVRQYLSLISHQPLNALDHRSFLRAYRRILDIHAQASRFKYESMFSDFDAQLHLLAKRLQVPADDSYKSRLPRVAWITGHQAGKSRQTALPPDPRMEIPVDLLKLFRRSQDYRKICSACDYDV
jgi:hypothetical protein